MGVDASQIIDEDEEEPNMEWGPPGRNLKAEKSRNNHYMMDQSARDEGSGRSLAGTLTIEQLRDDVGKLQWPGQPRARDEKIWFKVKKPTSRIEKAN